MAATMKDISRVTGLSIATVSKCINGQVIKEENRLLIEKAIEDLGYVRDESARSMKTGRSGIVALIVPTLDVSLICTFVCVCQSLLMSKGLTPVICISENSEKREQELVSTLKANQVDGMIIIPVSRDSTRAYDYLKDQNLPFVFFDQFIPSYPSDCVCLCGDEAFENLMISLDELGHKNIGIFLGMNPLSAFDRRAALIAKYAQQHGISCCEENMISGESGYECIKTLMNKPSSPTALICLSEDTTISAIMSLYRMGLKIPNDVSLIGVRNNKTIDNTLSIDLTLLDQPVQRCASSCVDILYEKLLLKYDKLPVGGVSRRIDVNVEFCRGSTISDAKK